MSENGNTNAKQLLVYESRLKEVAKGKLDNVRFDGDFADAASKKMAELVENAVARAQANGRSTLRPSDL